MNYYLKKRLQNRIKRSDMANALGLDYQRYLAIEKGDVAMPKNLIDKFNEIINKRKENEITRLDNELKADEFWKEVSTKQEDGRFVLFNKMREFNIMSLKQLANLIGYSSTGTIYNYLEGRNVAGVEFKKRLYNFFSNELNVQIPTKIAVDIKTKKRIKKPAVDTKLDKYYDKTDFKKILREYNLTNTQISKEIGVHVSTVSTMTSKKYKPSYRIIQAVKDYLDNAIVNANTSEEVVVEPTVEIKNDTVSRQAIIDECQKEIDKNNLKIAELKRQIEELERKNDIPNKLIALVKSL